MAEHWHLTPQTGEVKGNNPYQLNRMTMDSSFRAPAPTVGYDLANIQGYSATGDVILKGDRLSLAATRTVGLASNITGPVAAANTECNIAEFPSSQHGGSRHHRHRHNQIQQLRLQGQQTDVVIRASQSQTQSQTQSRSDGYASADWQQAFSNGTSQSHMEQLNDLTEARYKAIMQQSVHF